MRAAILSLATTILVAATQAVWAQDRKPALLAPTSQTVSNLAGAWEIASPDASRKCRVLLNPRETAERRMVLGAPPACRMAMPALTGAAQWGLGEDGRIHLYKQDGAALGAFRRELDGVFRAEGWVELTLTAIGGRPTEAPRAETVAATLQALTGETPAKDVDRAALVGRYNLTRTRDAEGCGLDLRRIPGPRPKQGGPVWSVTLDQACRDDGLRVFDPVGWQYEHGRVFLVARKGHTIGFTAERDGGWVKDPVAGRPLWMRRK
jgi:hypothetical protein